MQWDRILKLKIPPQSYGDATKKASTSLEPKTPNEETQQVTTMKTIDNAIHDAAYSAQEFIISVSLNANITKYKKSKLRKELFRMFTVYLPSLKVDDGIHALWWIVSVSSILTIWCKEDSPIAINNSSQTRTSYSNDGWQFHLNWMGSILDFTEKGYVYMTGICDGFKDRHPDIKEITLLIGIDREDIDSFLT